MTPTDTHAGDTDDTASVYDAIATFGLTEDADSLPLPESADDIAGLAGRCVAEAFDALIGALHGTGMEGEIEPLAHGLASLINRRWQAHEAALAKERDTLAGIVRTLDRTGAVRIPESLLRLEGTGEVADDMIARITDRTRRLRQRCDVLEEMAGLAARAYAAETGRPFRPAGRPGRSPKPALTGAVFEARELLDAEAKREADRMAVTGSPSWSREIATGATMPPCGTCSTAAARHSASAAMRAWCCVTPGTASAWMPSRRHGRRPAPCRRWCSVRTGPRTGRRPGSSPLMPCWTLRRTRRARGPSGA